MGWQPIPSDEWDARADQDFWKPYARKRSDRLKAKMVRQQVDVLSREDLAVAEAFVSGLARDQNESAYVRAQCFDYLGEAAVQAGDIDGAIDHAMRYCELRPTEGLPVLVRHVFDYDRAERAAEAVAVLRRVSIPPERVLGLQPELQLAALLSFAGNKEEARDLANRAFDNLAAQSHGFMYGSLAHAFRCRAVNRALFALVRRGGVVRIVGLLGANSTLTPIGLAAKLARHVYFNKAIIEPFPHRLVVDLDEFSLDFRWIADPTVMQQAQRRYDSFKYEDRRHIPDPPSKPEQALIVLAIGDDTSIPDVINPMIELVDLLDGFGECLFYDRIGPLSRRDDLEPFERANLAQVNKLIRSKLKPLFVEAGFAHCTTRRFDLTDGPLGYAAGIFLQIDKTSLMISAQLQIYYRDLLMDDLLKRYTNDAGEFRPKAFLVAPSQYQCQFAKWKPDNPGHDAIAAVIDTIAEMFRDEWLPLIQRTRDPRLELTWIVENLDSIAHQKLQLSSNRFGSQSRLELALAMAQLIGADDLQTALVQKSEGELPH